MDGFLGNYGISADQLEMARFWEAFARVFRVVALGTGALLAIAFVVWPVFSRHFRRVVGRARIGRRFAAHLLGLIGLVVVAARVFLRAVVSALRLGSGARRGGMAAGPGEEAKEAGGGRARTSNTVPLSVRHQRGLVERMLGEIFAEGTKKGASWQPWLTAREYSLELARAYPQIRSSLETVVDTAETALYSPHKVDRRRIRMFREAARHAVDTLKEA
jgi:hypothetical protein